MVKTRVLLTILLITLISSCSQIPSFLFGGGGGPNVAANTQIGKENNQGINIRTTTEPVLRPENNVEAPVGTINQNVTQTTNVDHTLIMWLILIGLLGWLLPTPSQMRRALLEAVTAPFKRKD